MNSRLIESPVLPFPISVTETERPAVEQWLAACPGVLILQWDNSEKIHKFATASALNGQEATRINALRAFRGGRE